MKCPKCKKPSELQTKRTMANGREVTRERFCVKCKNRFITIERFDTDIAEHDSEYERQLNVFKQNYGIVKNRLSEYDDLFIGLKLAIDKAGKDVR